MMKTVLPQQIPSQTPPAAANAAPETAKPETAKKGEPKAGGTDFELSHALATERQPPRGLRLPCSSTLSVKSGPALPQLSQLCKAQAAVQALDVGSYLTHRLDSAFAAYRACLAHDDRQALKNDILQRFQTHDPEAQAAHDLAQLPPTVLEPMTHFARTPAGKTLFQQLPRLSADFYSGEDIPLTAPPLAPRQVHLETLATVAQKFGSVSDSHFQQVPELVQMVISAWTQSVSEVHASTILEWLGRSEGEAYLQNSADVMVGGVPRSTYSLAELLAEWARVDAARHMLGARSGLNLVSLDAIL